MKIMLPCQQKNASMAVLPDGLHSCFSVARCAEIAAPEASCCLCNNKHTAAGQYRVSQNIRKNLAHSKPLFGIHFT